MKLLATSSFVAFELTPEEEIEAFTFNELNKAAIQNLISDAAEELLQIRLDGKLDSPEEREKAAFTSGQIEILKFLLANSTALKEELAAARAQEQNSNQTQEGN